MQTVETAKPSAALPPLLKAFRNGTLAFFVLSWIFHGVAFFVFHLHGHMVYPLSLNSHDRFYDFTIFTDKFKLFHTAEFFQVGYPINYPAPTAVLFKLFFLLPHSLFFFVAFCVLSFIIPAFYFAKALIQRSIRPAQAATFVTIGCLMSWPVLLLVDGANAEVFVWLSLLIAFWAYTTNRGWLAAVMFGVAAALKLFPFIFLALFLSRRRFRELLFGAATFLVVSIVGLKILGPTVLIAYRGIAYGLKTFKTDYFGRWRPAENGVDHSLLAFFKGFMVVVFHHQTWNFAHWVQLYLVATALGGTALYVFYLRTQPLLNQILVLSIASIYFTAFSGDGTLIHLYYPLAMLFFLAIQAWRDGIAIHGLPTILYSMMFTLSMESFFVLDRAEPLARFIGPMHCLSLGVMLIAALRYPLGPPLDAGYDETELIHPITGWARKPAATS